MKKWTVVALCALVATTAIWATFFRTSDEDAIKEAIARLAKTVMVEEGDNVLSRTARIKSELAETVEDDVHVDVSDLGVHAVGRRELTERAAQAGLVFTSSSCELVGTKVALDESRTTAKADTTVVFTGVRGGERRVDRRDVHLLLRKDGRWRVSTVDVQTPE